MKKKFPGAVVVPASRQGGAMATFTPCNSCGSCNGDDGKDDDKGKREAAVLVAAGKPSRSQG